MRIIVTKEDIEEGRARDAQNCPVALALRRAGVVHFGVSGILVWVASGNQAVVLPGHVQEWILNYDYGLQMAPIDFDLHLTPTEEPEKTAVLAQDSAWKLPVELLQARGMAPEPVQVRCKCGRHPAGGRQRDRRRRVRELVGA